MSTSELVESARKALVTNQPNLASLYMNRALKELAKR